MITLLNTLTGHLAMWAVRQSPYVCPDNLAVVLGRFRDLAAQTVEAEECDGHVALEIDGDAFAVEDFLRRVLSQIPEFVAWNEPKSGHGAEWVAVSRFGGPAPDDDFIDLDALYRNVASTVFAEEDER